MEFKDYYATLGVTKQTSQEDIQRAYRQLARQYHPDINQAAGAEDRFKEIGEAYEVLKDPEKRAKYDRYGAAWKAAEQHGGTPPPGYEDVWFDLRGMDDSMFGGGSGFSHFFDQLFGGMRGAGTRGGTRPQGWAWSQPGADREARLSLNLEEAAHGGERELSLHDPTTGQTKTCMVRIPKGVLAGQRIRLAGKGEPGMGQAPPGDLYLSVEVLPHADFRLEGRDLYTTVAVTPWEAALGAQVRLPTLDGAVSVKIPEGSSSGRKIRLKGKGFPEPRHGRGDLYVEISIRVPEHLTAEERALFQQLATVSPFAPRPLHGAKQ